MSTKAYKVEGMTCQHCVRAVTDEVGKIAGVDAVEVDLESGTVRVSGGRLDDSAVAAAVDEAGYSVVG
jgi:copper chaperone